MTNFWVSWYTAESPGGFEMHSPWWISGYTGDGSETIFVAAVRAESEEAAWAYVQSCFDNPMAVYRERFIETVPEGRDAYPFSSRFPKESWMDWTDEKTCGCGACP